MLRVCIQEPTNHALILGVVLLCFALEKVNAAFGERERNFHVILAKDNVFWWWEDILDNPRRTDWLIRVFYFRVRNLLSLSPMVLRREYE
jgi:hypothetical protein